MMNTCHSYICSNPVERTPRVNTRVNYGLWVITMYQHSFIICTKYTTLVSQDAKKSLHSYFQPKTSLKSTVYFLKSYNGTFSVIRVLLQFQKKGWSRSYGWEGSKHLTHLKSPWCWERLRAEGEGGVRGWGGWMAPLMQWTWTWASFRRWWGTGRPGVLQSMGQQIVGHGWATKQRQRT